jgi:hypothetical protein
VFRLRPEGSRRKRIDADGRQEGEMIAAAMIFAFAAGFFLALAWASHAMKGTHTGVLAVMAVCALVGAVVLGVTQ